MVRMLVFNATWREDNFGADASDNSRQLDGVGGENLQMCVAVELEKFNGRAEQRCGGLCLGDTLFGRAVAAGFTVRTNDKMHGPSGAGFACDDAAAGEFDVIWMRAKYQQRDRGLERRSPTRRVGR